jgi:hypothetical protein
MYDKLFSSENFKVAFANTTKNKFEIDRLKIWDYNNNLEIANINKHFINYEADSSSVIFHTNFENLDEFYNYKNSKQLFLNVENVNYKNSDAPIFSKAPQLTVNVGSSYNSIVWYVQEYKVAKEFILERALGDGKFIEVFKMQAEYDPLKIYNYTDEVIAEADVAFYRVKQINDDGSYVFSAEVKIGHKEIHEFNLGQNYPNPFNPITNLYVEVIITSEFDINVYDLVGNNVKKVFKGVLPEGLHTFEFDGASLPSGIYFYEVMSPHSQIVKKMILAK